MLSKLSLAILVSFGLLAAAAPGTKSPEYTPPSYGHPTTECNTKYYTKTSIGTSYKDEVGSTTIYIPTVITKDKPCSKPYTKTDIGTSTRVVPKETVITRTVPVVVTKYETKVETSKGSYVVTDTYTKTSIGQSVGTCPTSYTTTTYTLKPTTTHKPYPYTSTKVEPKTECKTKGGYGY